MGFLTRDALSDKRLGLVTGLRDLYGCEILRIIYFINNRLTDGGKVPNPTHRPLSTPAENVFCFYYSFLLKAE
jgi:hypothetical protein